VTVSVDLKGLEEGYYILSPKIDEEAYAGFTIMSEAASVTLTDITYNEADEADDAAQEEAGDVTEEEAGPDADADEIDDNGE